MAFPYQFSRIAEAMRPSPIRELFPMTQRPGMISFAGGLPDPAIFPVEEFAQCGSVLRDQGKTALQYGASEGFRPLIDELIKRMEPLLGRPFRPEELVIGSGSQQVMDMLARVLIDPGDVVIVEAPTYPGALHTFRNSGACFAPVPCDEDGMLVDALPEVVQRCKRQTGRLPKLIYSIVNFSNPAGVCLSLPRRRRLAELALSHGIPVLEDDPYGELRYSGAAIPALFSLADSGIIFASSFSKILAPGVRVAWAIGDPSLIRKMVVAKQGMDLCTSMVTQVLVAEYCRRGFLETHLGRIRSHYAGKAEAMARAFRKYLPTGSIGGADPEGGFFFWRKLAHASSRVLFERAVEEGVAFLPGSAFFPAPDEVVGEGVDGDPFARFCFTFASPSEIEEGARRLARALAGHD